MCLAAQHSAAHPHAYLAHHMLSELAAAAAHLEHAAAKAAHQLLLVLVQDKLENTHEGGAMCPLRQLLNYEAQAGDGQD